MPGQECGLTPSSCRWSLWATLTLWKGTDAMLPPEPFCRYSHGFSLPMDVLSRSRGPSGQEWLPAPSSCRWSLWATLTLWKGTDSMLPLEPLRRYSNGFAVPMDLHGHLVQPPGPKWLQMSRMASTSLMLSNGHPGRLGPFVEALTLSYFLDHWKTDRMAALLQWTAEATL